MDQNTLVISGQALVSALDDAGIPPRVAMWVHSPDMDTWKLWIVPHASIKDKLEFYKRVAEIASKNRTATGGIKASDTEMKEDDHPAMQGLRRYITAPGLNSISFSGNKFNGFYLPDGIILRVDFSSATRDRLLT